jgi:hypothetical protein
VVHKRGLIHPFVCSCCLTFKRVRS